MIKACIFDLDGVIVDTAKYHYLAWKELAESLGIDFTEEDNEHLKGVGRMESLEFILGLKNMTISDEEKLKLAANKNDRYVSLISLLSANDILPGVMSFLDDLKANDIKIALGSSSKNARPVLENLCINSYFKAIVDGTNISRSKPDPEVFLLGANVLNVPPKNIVVFEDAKAGVEAAKAGGFLCVGIGNQDELSIADMVVENLEGFSLQYLKTNLDNQE